VKRAVRDSLPRCSRIQMSTGAARATHSLAFSTLQASPRVGFDSRSKLPSLPLPLQLPRPAESTAVIVGYVLLRPGQAKRWLEV